MNRDKLAKLSEQVRVGGKGVPRRKRKVVHKTANTDDRKLQNSLKKLPVTNIPGIEEVSLLGKSCKVSGSYTRAHICLIQLGIAFHMIAACFDTAV